MIKWVQLKCVANRLFVFMLFFAAFSCSARAQNTNLLKLEKRIPLPKVKGRIDHMAVDIKGQRLFIAALGNNSLEVLDLKSGERTRSIGGLKEPQGALYVPEFNKIFVTNAGDGTCEVFDGSSYKLIQTIRFPGDADNIRYDPPGKQVFIGFGEGGIGVVDAETGEHVGDVKFKGHPEAFEIEKSGTRLFANLPAKNRIIVTDRKKLEVIAEWPLVGEKDNFPMALDESGHKLFVGFRNPAKVVIYDTESGEPTESLDISTDSDDIFYDPAKRRLYVSCGEGSLYVFNETKDNLYKLGERVTTAKGARTSLLVPEKDLLCVAIPRKTGQRAEIRIYKIM